jgi:hypothetical protein
MKDKFGYNCKKYKGSSMCDFNALTDEEKVLHHQKLLQCANAFGGKNFFLQLLEAIRETKPHPGTRSSLTTNFSFSLKLV